MVLLKKKTGPFDVCRKCCKTFKHDITYRKVNNVLRIF